jgi:hypothetical protein
MFVVRDNLRDLWHIGRTRQEIFPVQQLTGASLYQLLYQYSTAH